MYELIKEKSFLIIDNKNAELIAQFSRQKDAELFIDVLKHYDKVVEFIQDLIDYEELDEHDV